MRLILRIIDPLHVSGVAAVLQVLTHRRRLGPASTLWRTVWVRMLTTLRPLGKQVCHGLHRGVDVIFTSLCLYSRRPSPLREG